MILPLCDETVNWPYVAMSRVEDGWAWDVFYEDDSKDRGGVAATLYEAFAAISSVIGEAN